jgi:Rrf2 family protein
MKLSKRGEYALRALINLGLARELGRPMLQIRELAEHENIPVKFLEQILAQLKGAGYLDSRRGKRGGYFLKKPMGRIAIGEIVRLIDGPLAPIRCVSQTAYDPCSCPDENHCGLRILMLDVRNAIAGILDRHTLADVVGVTLKKIRRDGAPLPSWDGGVSRASPAPAPVPSKRRSRP